MNQKEINDLALVKQKRARSVLAESGIADIWKESGCRVNIIGSLRMGLLASHRDIDLHVYSKGITVESSFAIASRIAKNPCIAEVKCINGLHTDEHCIAWHFYYKYEGELWQFDVIHIEEGSQYDGYFENMADRIVEVMTGTERDTILRLKFETTAGTDYHGVEYYEAVIADGVRSMNEFECWIEQHRKKPMYYWIP